MKIQNTVSERRLTLEALLKLYGFSDKELRSDVKIVRHTLNHDDARACYNAGREMFEIYQFDQPKEKFKNTKYVVSFVGDKRSSARFYGIYRVGKPTTGSNRKYPANYPGDKDGESFLYEFEPDDRMDELKDRLVIDWGKNKSICWVQSATNTKYVIGISPKLNFPGYDKVNLSFSELKNIIDQKEESWEIALKNIYAVYMITCPYGIYIGSATGSDGLWGRWKDYINPSYTGDNKYFKMILKKNPEAYRDFSFSILKALPRISDNANIIKDAEYFYMRIFKTKADGSQPEKKNWGLNAN